MTIDDIINRIDIIPSKEEKCIIYSKLILNLKALKQTIRFEESNDIHVESLHEYLISNFIINIDNNIKLFKYKLTQLCSTPNIDEE